MAPREHVVAMKTSRLTARRVARLITHSCHSRASGNPGELLYRQPWTPACAGVTLRKIGAESQTKFWYQPEARLREVRLGAVFAGSCASVSSASGSALPLLLALRLLVAALPPL